jgi:hypothetical protein
MAVSLSAFRNVRALFLFLVLISVRSPVWLEGLGKLKEIQRPHPASNTRSSRLQHIALTNYTTACPQPVFFAKYNYNDEVKEDENGRAFNMNECEEECV